MPVLARVCQGEGGGRRLTSCTTAALWALRDRRSQPLRACHRVQDVRWRQRRATRRLLALYPVSSALVAAEVLARTAARHGGAPVAGDGSPAPHRTVAVRLTVGAVVGASVRQVAAAAMRLQGVVARRTAGVHVGHQVMGLRGHRPASLALHGWSCQRLALSSDSG